MNEQHFWSRLCHELGWTTWPTSTSTHAPTRAPSSRKRWRWAIAGRERDALVTALAGAGVPVAPVLRRREMVATAPFPPFPIRLDLPERPGPVPSLDEHRGEEFRT